MAGLDKKRLDENGRRISKHNTKVIKVPEVAVLQPLKQMQSKVVLQPLKEMKSKANELKKPPLTGPIFEDVMACGLGLELDK